MIIPKIFLLNSKTEKFGTFGGVFTPSILTILGVIMFLRFSTVVGYAGLFNALLILAGGKLITIITGLSISSVATNMKVKGGGAYYLISRSIGIEFGGVVAIFFFIAQAVAVTMYITGFTESIFSAFPNINISFLTVSTITNILVFLCVYIGAGWTIRVQYFILTILLLSVFSFFIGASINFNKEILISNLYPAWTNEYSFFSVFALFFPAVTGIMAGVNMSGDLKDPSYSIPKGTFAAIFVSGIIYALITILLATSVPRYELLSEGFIMKKYSISHSLIYAGVISATLSSALGSMMGAPRILQAFAKDDVFRKLSFLAKGSEKTDEPRRATLLTFLISQIGIFAGDLNAIAPIITMFFLMTYGTVNLACFYEGVSNNPSFRPKFKFNHWSISLIGAILCLLVMFLINFIWAIIALIISSFLYFLIAKYEIQVKWGDLNSGLAYQRARSALLRLEKEPYHPKNWRPSILTLSGGAYNRLHLANYACWFTTESGIVSIAQVIRGNLYNLFKEREDAENNLRNFILKEELAAFPVVVVEEDIHMAIKALLQCHGLGGLRTNTVLLGWSEDPKRTGVFNEILTLVKNMKRNLIVAACEKNEERTIKDDGIINIWWNNDKNGELMLILAYLLKKNPEWSNHSLRIIYPVGIKSNIQIIEKDMKDILINSRINAELVVIPTTNNLLSIKDYMANSSVLIVGFEPNDDGVASKHTELQEIINLPGDVILVYNAGEVSVIA